MEGLKFRETLTLLLVVTHFWKEKKKGQQWVQPLWLKWQRDKIFYHPELYSSAGFSQQPGVMTEEQFLTATSIADNANCFFLFEESVLPNMFLIFMGTDGSKLLDKTL